MIKMYCVFPFIPFDYIKALELPQTKKKKKEFHGSQAILLSILPCPPRDRANFVPIRQSGFKVQWCHLIIVLSWETNVAVFLGHQGDDESVLRKS